MAFGRKRMVIVGEVKRVVSGHYPDKATGRQIPTVELGIQFDKTGSGAGDIIDCQAREDTYDAGSKGLAFGDLKKTLMGQELLAYIEYDGGGKFSSPAICFLRSGGAKAAV